MVSSSAPKKVARQTQEKEECLIRSPGVGYFQSQLAVGAYVRAGSDLGFLRILGQKHRVILQPKAADAYIEALLITKGPVEYNQPLIRLMKGSPSGQAFVKEEQGPEADSTSPTISAPQPGRVYLRPEPDKASYVSIGTEVSKGDVLLLIEIMKTFTPLVFQGSTDNLPEKARIVKVLVEDGAEIERGQALFEIESL